MSLLANPLYLELSLSLALSLLAACAVYLWLGRRQGPPRVHGWPVLLVASAAYALVFASLALLRYRAYNMGMLDLGGMDQAIWNSLHSRLLQTTTLAWGQVSRLAVHVEPIYVALAPLYLLWDDVRVLLLLQTLALALTLWPLAALARARLGPQATLAGVALLLYPPLQYGNLADFHADALALPLLMTALWAYETRRPRSYALAAVAAMACKEYVPLLVAALGVYALLQRRWRWGLASLLGGGAWFALALLVVIPAFTPERQAYYLEHYASLGGSEGVAGMLRNAVEQPLSLLASLLTPAKLGYLALLLTPMALLPLLSPGRLAVAAPMLGVLLLHPSIADIRNHHTLVLIAPLAWAALGGLERLGSTRLRPALGAWLVAALAGSVLYGPSPLGWKFWTPGEWLYHGHWHSYRHTRHDRVLDRLLEQLPPHTPGSASPQLGAHLSHRQTLHVFPLPFAGAPPGYRASPPDWVLVDVFEAHPQSWLPPAGEGVAQLLGGADWRLAAARDGVLLFRRSGVGAPPGLALERSRRHHPAPASGTLRLTRLRLALWPGASTGQPARLRAELELECGPQAPQAVPIISLQLADGEERLVDWLALAAPPAAGPCGAPGRVRDVLEGELPEPVTWPLETRVGLYRMSPRFAPATSAREAGPWYPDYALWETRVGELDSERALEWQAAEPQP